MSDIEIFIRGDRIYYMAFKDFLFKYDNILISMWTIIGIAFCQEGSEKKNVTNFIEVGKLFVEFNRSNGDSQFGFERRQYLFAIHFFRISRFAVLLSR